MKSKVTNFLGMFAVFFALCTFFSHAQAQTLIVATGGVKGSTYSAVFQELNKYCGQNGEITEMHSGGSNDNIDKLVGNQVNAALVQTDVVFFRSATEDLSKIKTVFALFPEQVHFVARAEGQQEGGVLGFGGKTIHFNTIADLAGRNVGAAGGSVLTSKVVSKYAKLNYNTVEFKTNDEALAALQDKKVDAVVIVGGQPMAAISALSAAYKLLSVGPAQMTALSGVYQPSRANYRNVNAAGVQTISTQAILISREYHSPKFVNALSQYRACFYKNLQDIQDTTGTHPAFQEIDPNNHGKWAWMDLK
jgi:TRAP transporter TAXI family solute receptor